MNGANNINQVNEAIIKNNLIKNVSGANNINQINEANNTNQLNRSNNINQVNRANKKTIVIKITMPCHTLNTVIMVKPFIIAQPVINVSTNQVKGANNVNQVIGANNIKQVNRR